MKDFSATILIDTKGKSEEEIFRNVEYTRRKNVKKAIRSGLVAEETGSEEDYKSCYKMYSQVIREGGSSPFSYEAWRDWAKKEGWKLFAIKKDGETAGYFSDIEINKK